MSYLETTDWKGRSVVFMTSEMFWRFPLQVGAQIWAVNAIISPRNVLGAHIFLSK